MHWSYFGAGSIDIDGDVCPCLSIKVVVIEWICIPKRLSFRFVVAFSGVELIAVRSWPCRHIGSELGCIPNLGL